MASKQSDSVVTELKMMCCAACGKPEDDGKKLKTCTACKSVKYCNVECQRIHRKAHKKKCKRIEKQLENEQPTPNNAGTISTPITALITSLSLSNDDMDADDDADLFKPSPPKEECPLCFQILPADFDERLYLTCCGKTICCGCDLKNVCVRQFEIFQRQLKDQPKVCAFCRANVRPKSDGELLAVIQKRMLTNDLDGLMQMSHAYEEGLYGLPLDKDKAVELLLRAVELGSPEACYLIAFRYQKGGYLGYDHSKCMDYLELAAKRGHVLARHSLGCIEANKGNGELAVKHWIISASNGHEDSLIRLSHTASKQLLEEARQAHKNASEKIASFERDMAQKYYAAGRDISVLTESEFSALCGMDGRRA